MVKVVDMARVLGLPETASGAEVFSEVLRLKRVLEEQVPANVQLVAIAKAKGGDLRTALQVVATERPDLIARYRREGRQPRSTHLDRASDAEKASLTARTQKAIQGAVPS
jgi:hypothetical protein